VNNRLDVEWKEVAVAWFNIVSVASSVKGLWQTTKINILVEIWTRDLSIWSRTADRIAPFGI